VHSLGVVLARPQPESGVVPKNADASIVIASQVDALLYRYVQPPRRAWGVDFDDYMCEGWDIGGKWYGWGDQARSAMRKQRVKLSTRPLPPEIRTNAIWAEDLVRLKFDRFRLYPLAVITPYGEWVGTLATYFGFGETKRELRARDAWIRKMRKAVGVWSDTIAVAIEFYY
jgi:hypothetical protein